MKNFDIGIFYGVLARDFVWIRIAWLKYGIAIKKTPKLYSEREGYKKSVPLPGGWRIMILKAKGY